MKRKLERCGECPPAARCANHLACATQRDAALASEIGAAWAVFVRGQVDVRQSWPPFSGRVARIALRLVADLAPEPRRTELARICHWRAGLKWEALERPRIRDRPYEAPDGSGVVFDGADVRQQLSSVVTTVDDDRRPAWSLCIRGLSWRSNGCVYRQGLAIGYVLAC